MAIYKAPPAFSTTYIKSTASSRTTGFTSVFPAVDWENTPREYFDAAEYNSWRTATNSYNGAKINIDYGTAFTAVEIRIYNYFDYDSGGDYTENTTYGFTSFKVYGSNSSTDFNNTTLNSVPSNATLLLDSTALDEQPGFAQYVDELSFAISNSTAYQYYIIMFSGTHGQSQGGLRVLGLFEGVDPDVTGDLDDIILPSLTSTFLTKTYLVNPPAFNTTYIKSTPSNSSDPYNDPWRIVDPDNPVYGSSSYASWLSGSGKIIGAKINIDYGQDGGFVAHLLRLWNYHSNGTDANLGVASIRVYGSNSQADFDNTTRDSIPANATLLLDTTSVLAETSSNGTEQLFWLGNTNLYRYYILFFLANHGGPLYVGLRRALLQGMPRPITASMSSLALPSIRLAMDAQTGGYVRLLPVAQSNQYVQSSSVDITYAPFLATSQDFDTALTGPAVNNSWLSNTAANTTFLIHANSRSIPKYLDIENFHDSGSDTDRGVNAFTLYGGNDANTFETFDWSRTSGPEGTTLLLSGNMAQHPATDVPNRERFTFSTSSSFRYYYFFFLSNHGSNTHTGLRRLTLWGADDPTVWADISTHLPFLTTAITAPAPEIVAHIDTVLKRMVVGLSDGPPPAIVTAFKAMTAFMVVNNEEGPPVGNLDITLPSLTAENPEPAWGHLDATMPRMVGTLTSGADARCTLPAITAGLSARPPSILSRLDCVMAPMGASLTPGNPFTANMPSLQALMSATVQFRVVITASMRAPTCAMTGSSSADPEEIDVVMAATLPRMRMSSVAMVGRSADITATMRALSLSMHGIPGVVSRLSANIPRLSVGMAGRPSSCTLAATLPALEAEMETSHICATTTIKYEKGAVQ